MRRVLSFLAAIGLITALFPATVAAAKPLRDSFVTSGLVCELSSEAGFVRVMVDAVGTDAFADLAIWAPGDEPFEDLPYIMSAENMASLDGSSFRADFDLVEVDWPTNPEDPPTTRPIGSARLSAVRTALGPPELFDSRDFRDGNRRYTIEATIQAFGIAGALVLDLRSGVQELDLASCDSATFSQTTFVTNPTAWVTKTRSLFIECEWVTELGAIRLAAVSDEFGSFSELDIFNGDRWVVGLTSPDISPTGYQATYELFDRSAGATVGTAVADATLTRSGERISENAWVDPQRIHMVGDRLTADGTLFLTLDGVDAELAMDDASCDAGDVLFQVIEKTPRG